MNNITRWEIEWGHEERNKSQRNGRNGNEILLILDKESKYLSLKEILCELQPKKIMIIPWTVRYTQNNTWTSNKTHSTKEIEDDSFVSYQSLCWWKKYLAHKVLSLKGKIYRNISNGILFNALQSTRDCVCPFLYFY